MDLKGLRCFLAVAEVAKLMMDAGLVVVTAFISPFRAEREMARELIGAEHFIEVFVDTPLEVPVFCHLASKYEACLTSFGIC